LKRILMLFGVLILTLIMPNTVLATPNVILDGQQLSFDVPPIIEDGRTLVPLRTIFEALGAKVSWDENTQTAAATKADISIKLQINSKTAYKNNQAVSLDVAPKIVKDRTLIPLRFVSEALGAKVGWNEENMTITINNNDIAQSLVGDGGNQEYNFLGNSPGNIENHGFASQEQGWIYFSTFESGLLKMRLDGTDFTGLTQDKQITDINVKDGWVYYDLSEYNQNINNTEGFIYKIKTDGSQKTLLLKDSGSFSSMIIVDDWIYFTHRPGYNESRGYITRIKNDGSERTKLSEITTQTLYYDDGWLYTDQNVELTKMKIDGSEIKKLDNEQPITIAITNDWIYYEIVVDWDHKIFARYRIKKAGTDKQRVDEGIRNYFMNFSGEWIYYTVGDYNGGILYKMRPDATDRTLVLNDKVAFINFIGDWIIYQNGWGGETRKIRTDGSNKARLINGIWQDLK